MTAKAKITLKRTTMKKLTLAIIASMCMMLQGNAKGIIIVKKLDTNTTPVHRFEIPLSPTSAYDPVKRTLFIWTKKGECDVTISIYKDDEEVAYETIFVEPGEEISCDFSDCEAGEYTIYTTIDGEMELIDTITVK